MSSPANYSPRISPQHFNALSDDPQESQVSSEGKRTEEVSQRTLNTNFEPSTRKRARQEDPQFRQEGNPKKFRPLSARAIEDARQVVSNKMRGLPVNDQRLEYAQKILQDYESYETHQTHTPKKVSKGNHNLGNQRCQDRKRAWSLAAAARADAPEDAKKHARRMELKMEKFAPERQAFIREEAEKISQSQITLEEQENERFRAFAEEISQIESD